MKKIRWLFIPLLFSLSNCVSIQNYLSNRAFDLSDIVTIGGEANTYGASAWLWCFGGGLQIAQDGKGLGMRNGYIGSYRTGGNRKLGKLKMGNSFFLMNSQEHIPEAYKTSRSMRKKYTHANFLFILPASLQGRWRSNQYYTNPNNYNNNYDFINPSANLPNLCHAPVNVEFSLGLGIGARIGINFSEALDFILGLTTYDLMEDDALNKEETEEE
ncbi:MAG TPA: hypothetical protein PK079_08305 [Leptospiraceae bacterium]|nr:hypothetical protein [Leptospiraceae bacterium]HMW06327.1 hypothetical protein [Leptospiraceae bacterium]HMX30994.1 hypothetical protein [Leptospiraceae bacterium]HMY32187.1 hypothetical protein [Leptospiraceae bacterium]HMZ63812.1 hypothetical protein [Leptospiraceae bacterium]